MKIQKVILLLNISEMKFVNIIILYFLYNKKKFFLNLSELKSLNIFVDIITKII